MKKIPAIVPLSILFVFIYLFGTGDAGLEFKGDENFYFVSAGRMLQSGDMMTPSYMGRERLQKPILFYWLIAACFKLLGASWFAARLPSVIAGLLCAYCAYAVADMFFSRRAAVYSFLFLATTPLFYRYARIAVPDMVFAFFVTLSVYFLARWYNAKDDRISPYLFFASMAFAFMTKGPTAVLIPALLAVAFSLAKKKKNIFRTWKTAGGLAVFFLIVLPWFYVIYSTHGRHYADQVLGREILQRIGYGRSENMALTYFKGIAFYAQNLVFRFLPYSLFLPAALAGGVWSEYTTQRQRDRYSFIITWLAVVFFFFTFIAERRAHYLLALAPALAILAAVYFDMAVSNDRFFSKNLFRLPYIMSCCGIAFFSAGYVASDLISSKSTLYLSIAMSVLLFSLVISTLAYGRRRYWPLVLPSGLALLFVMTTVSPPFGLFRNRMEKAAVIIGDDIRPGCRLVIGSHGMIQEELQAFYDAEVEDARVSYHGDGTPDLGTASRLIDILTSDSAVFCVIKKKDYDIFIPGHVKEKLFVLGSYHVWKRRIKHNDDWVGKGIRDVFQNEIYVVSNKG